MRNLGFHIGKSLDPKLRIKRWKILTGDYVEIMSGRSKGQRGKVLKVFHKTNKLIVDGANMSIRTFPKGMSEVSENEAKKSAVAVPLHYSRVALIDPSDDKPCKTRWFYKEDGSKTRASKRTGTLIDKPKHLPKLKELPNIIGAKDTDPDNVLLQTFDEDTLNPLLKASRNYRAQALPGSPYQEPTSDANQKTSL